MPLDWLAMDERRVNEAACILWEAWSAGRRISGLPRGCRPGSLDEGYAIQRAVAERSGSGAVGWKLAATSEAGQAHIGVDGPLAGRLLGSRVYRDGADVPAGPLHMGVAEAEFAFRMGRDLPSRGSSPGAPFPVEAVMEAVESLHPAIEVPDSRFEDFAVAGAPQLVADTACADLFVLGPAAPDEWRALDLASHPAVLRINGVDASAGSGANVLGDPRLALAWIANDRAARGEPLRAGEVVTTGTCVTPAPVRAGDELLADFGPLGAVGARLAA